MPRYCWKLSIQETELWFKIFRHLFEEIFGNIYGDKLVIVIVIRESSKLIYKWKILNSRRFQWSFIHFGKPKWIVYNFESCLLFSVRPRIEEIQVTRTKESYFADLNTNLAFLSQKPFSKISVRNCFLFRCAPLALELCKCAFDPAAAGVRRLWRHASSRDAIVGPIERIGAVYPLGSVNQSRDERLCAITVTFGEWPERNFIECRAFELHVSHAARAQLGDGVLERILHRAHIRERPVCVCLSDSLVWYIDFCYTARP